MKWALLLNLVLITLVAGDGAWKQNKEYKYKVLIKTLTASPKLNNRWIGTVLRARLLINPQSENLLIGKIDDAEYAEIELSQKWDADFNDEELSYNRRELNKPFKIHLQNGVIHTLSVDRSMTKDQKIQLKAIVSQLQVDTNKVERDGSNALYMTNEQTVTGTCETTYDISPLPDYLVQTNSDLIPLPALKGEGEVINMVKTRDHNKCKERFGIINKRNEYQNEYRMDNNDEYRMDNNNEYRMVNNNGYRMDNNKDYQNEYRMDNNVDLTESSRIVLSGSLKDYTIQSSATTYKVTVNDRQSFTTVHYVNLKLESMEESITRFASRPQILSNSNLKVEKLSVYEELKENDRIVTSNEQTDRSNEDSYRSNEKTFRSNEQTIRSGERLNKGMPRDSGDWSSCYTWFVGTEEMCRQSFNAEYSSERMENCGFAGLGHRSFCVRKYPGCESSVCWSAAIQDICTREFGDRLPISKGGYVDCAPGFARRRCCPK